MEVSGLLDYMIQGKLMWHHWCEFNSTSSVVSLLFIDLLYSWGHRSSEQAFPPSLLSQRKEKHLPRWCALRKPVFVTLASLETAWIQMQPLFSVEEAHCPVLHESRTTRRPLCLLGTLGASHQHLYCVSHCMHFIACILSYRGGWAALAAPEVMGCSGRMGGHQVNRLLINK